MEQTKHGISGNFLKMIAVCTMLIDHTAASVLWLALINGRFGWNEAYDTWYQIYLCMRVIGRMAFPIYCFLLVEGFHYTRSRAKYALRLFIFALVSEVPFDLALFDSWCDTNHNNVFFTLLIGLLCIWGLDVCEKRIGPSREEMAALEGTDRLKATLQILLRCVCMAAVLFTAMGVAEYVLCTDYGAAGVLAIVAIYLVYRYRMAAFALAVVILGCMSSTMEFAALLMLIPLYFYNGTRGKQHKYFFYAFYPVHLLILGIICRVMFH